MIELLRESSHQVGGGWALMLRPFFSYYGAKWAFGAIYPKPLHGTIVEPFAGSAGYACRWAGRRVVLIERDPTVAGVWDYLIKATASEIRALPARVQHVDEIAGPDEARALIGFWLNRGNMYPAKQPSAWMRTGIYPTSFWGEAVRDRIAKQVEAIRHWTITCGDYTAAPDVEATWFVDSPYIEKGRHYRFWRLDYDALAAWCRARRGQLIACEAAGATWLPFRPLAHVRTMSGSRRSGASAEVVYHRLADGTEMRCVDRRRKRAANERGDR